MNTTTTTTTEPTKRELALGRIAKTEALIAELEACLAEERAILRDRIAHLPSA